MKLSVRNFADGKAASDIEVADEVFDADYNEALVHQMVTAYMARTRQGSKAQKNRSAVRGGGIKPWRQKGTGRARAGTKSSPIWRSGGVTFAASPRNYEQKINRKMYKSALRSVVSELVRSERLVVVDSLEQDTAKTKDLVAKLKDLELDNVLLLAGEVSENLYLAARNIPNVGVVETQLVDLVALVSYQKIVATEYSIKQLEKRFK
jgi:large subunit ribosomal protein L4